MANTTSIVPPKYRPPEERAEDFEPAKATMSPAGLAASAGECAGCHGANRCVVPNCSPEGKQADVVLTGCPIGRNIPAFNKHVEAGNYYGAFMLDWADGNYMGALTGRLCPASHATSSGAYCETTCIHSTVHPAHNNATGSVRISSIEAGVHEWAIDHGKLPPLNPLNLDSGHSVGFIGDGAAAFYIGADTMVKGHGFSIYGRGDKPGGVVQREIAGFKFDQKYLDAYFTHLAKHGGKIHANTNVDADKLRELAKKHDVLVMGIGKSAGREARLEGDAAEEQINYQHLLDQQNRATAKGQALTDFTNGTLNAQGKVTAVMGVGETAMDCVRVLLRNGAAKIQVHYYRGPEAISSDPVDRRLAFEEAGVVVDDRMKDLLRQDGVSDEDIAQLSAAATEGRIEFIFDSQVSAQDYDGENYTLSYEQGGETKTTQLGLPLVVATGAGVESPQKQFGFPDHVVAKSGALIVDQAPELVGHPSNNPDMLASGLTAIIQTKTADGQEKFVPVFALGDCVSDSNGRNGPTVLVHSFAGVKALKGPINDVLADPEQQGRELAERYPQLVFAA